MADRFCGINLLSSENEILEDLEIATSSYRAEEEMKREYLSELMRDSYLERGEPSGSREPTEDEKARAYLQMLGELT